ncbi:sigma-54-dependent Fis family transcriptional regulator [Petroclostridium sp. X23]|uniref:sigma-54-dependent Fis family transcriptional regulator n=1 Tax=Petroclostridium sp. X23 TaxID=3045146 RepID=UPI0024AD847A|nr:sigma-54-dependent Fis family transcriptional regulator [Petroclostridium sp. X23]WHH61137.1 sigma 54-interacting transcriptional regulator [Petroclostridium sp. X23]
MNTRLVFLSYGKQMKLIKSVYRLYPDIEFVILEVTPEHVIEEILDLESKQHIDVLISSGSNARIIKQCNEINTPLVEIQVTGFDLLCVLKEVRRHSNKIAIITNKNLIPYLAETKSILRVDVEEYTYDGLTDLECTIDQLKESGIQDIIGGSYTCRLAEEKGLRGHLLWRIPAIKLAIDNSIIMAHSNKKLFSDATHFKTIINSTYEGIMSVSKTGIIELINPRAEKIIGISADKIIGKNVNDIIQGINVEELVTSNIKKINEFCIIDNMKVMNTQVPVNVHGDVTGVVITFQYVDIIQRASEAIQRHDGGNHFSAKTHFSDIIGKAPILLEAKKDAKIYANTPSTILINGESGTGKDLFAQSIHNASSRALKPFVAVNCASFPESLIESELFGYDEGAFTGARRGGKRGYFELAQGGTLFLDEISELSLPIQSRFLRVLEQHEFFRVGGQRPIYTDARVIAATNKSLLTLVSEQKFRIDLFYRLNILEIQLPPLRERIDDVADLAEFFLQSFRPDLSPSTIKRIANNELLTQYKWPGNIRELRNIMERFSVQYQGYDTETKLFEKILFIHPTHVCEEKQFIETALSKCNTETDAAKMLGVSRSTLWRKKKKLGI